jgi:hypothetical protein
MGQQCRTENATTTRSYGSSKTADGGLGLMQRQHSEREPMHNMIEESNACTPTVFVHSSISSSPDSHSQKRMPYRLGHAWQHGFLNQRLAFMREQPSSNFTKDRLLFLEHDPVYTLGRGADENNLVFLKKQESDHTQCTGSSLDKNGHGLELTAMRERLSRKARGPGSARLSSKCAKTEVDVMIRETESSLTIHNYTPCGKKISDSLIHTMLAEQCKAQWLS